MKTKLLKLVRKRFSIVKVENFNLDEYKYSLSCKYNKFNYDGKKVLYLVTCKTLFNIENWWNAFLTYDEAYSHLIKNIREKFPHKVTITKEVRTKIWY